MNTEQQFDNDSDEISVKELILKINEWWRYLYFKWPIIFLFGVIGSMIGVGYAFLTKPIYTATTTFVLADESGGGGSMGSLSGLASMAGIDLGGGGGGIFQGDNILQLYRSRKMIEKTLLTNVEIQGKKELLIERYIQTENLRKKWAKNPKLNNLEFNTDSTTASPNFNRLQDSIITDIIKRINKDILSVTKPDKKLSFIRADVTYEDEIFAKIFNEQIVKNVNDFYTQTKTKKSVENVSILELKRDSVQSVINKAIYSAVEIADATPNLNPTKQTQRIAPAQKSQFSAEANKAILSVLIQNLEMAKVTLIKDAPLIQVIDEPVLPLYKEKFGKLKGLIYGGLIAGFLAGLWFVIRRVFHDIMK